jgi:ribosomal protein L16 Arg81 hydroxylase
MAIVQLWKNYNKETPSWQEILENFEESETKGESIKANGAGFIVSHSAYRIPAVREVLKSLKLKEAHTYINLTSKGATFGRHSDPVDVWFWQVQGSTKWEFDDDECTLEAGDLLFVPKGEYHNVIPLSPRCGISMSVE